MKRAKHLLKILDDHDSESIDAAAGIRRSGPLAVPLLLILAYASSPGGMTTLVGSPTNSVAVGLYRSELPPDAPNVYFSHWFLCCLPISLIYFGIVWYVLVRKLPSASPSDQDLAAALRQRLSSLGPMSKPEFRMLILFSIAAMLWVTREPMELGKVKLFAGWYSLYADLFVVLSDYLGAPSSAWQIFVGNGKAIISDATVNAVIPTVLALAGSLDMDPRLLFVPATLACSCGFMLPVGTPPNAIVFSTGRIPAREMVIQGLWLNLIGVPILTAGTYLLIRPIMGIQ